MKILFADGFEAPQVNTAEGSLRLPTAALAELLDDVARSIFWLDDGRGEVARVYACLHLGAVEYALAVRAADGSWTLGPWTGKTGAVTLIQRFGSALNLNPYAARSTFTCCSSMGCTLSVPMEQPGSVGSKHRPARNSPNWRTPSPSE